MKTYKRSNKSRNIVIAIVLILIVGLLLWYVVKQHRTTSNLPANVAQSSSPADNNLNNQRKTSTSPASTLNNGATTTPSTSHITVTITRAGVVDNNLQVGTLVNGSTQGTCTLSVTQAGQNDVTATNQVTLQNNSYVCPTFDIPLSRFPNQQNWNVSVSVSSGNSSGSSNWVDNPISLSTGQ